VDGKAGWKAMMAAGMAASAVRRFNGKPQHALTAARNTALNYETESVVSYVVRSAIAALDAPTANETLCALLRHIVGSPFRSAVAHDPWSETVIGLANALYDGEDCAFALHDALLEEGHGDLAGHIRDENHHPKGCWVVDLLLGKE